MIREYVKRISIAIIFLGAFSAAAQEAAIKEDFNSLDLWETLLFPKIKEHSHYEILSTSGESVLRITSQGSASGLVAKESFDVFEFSLLKWKWKVSKLLEGVDGGSKKGDDYPIRLYVIFEYDPQGAGAGQKLKYNLAKVIYGEYPPDSGLNYVWANIKYSEDFFENPYTGRAIMIPLEEGSDYLNQWREHQVNVLEDYRRIFGEDPPRRAKLAIMGDSDNTGGTTEAFLDYVVLFKE